LISQTPGARICTQDMLAIPLNFELSFDKFRITRKVNEIVASFRFAQVISTPIQVAVGNWFGGLKTLLVSAQPARRCLVVFRFSLE
jgi:hypothetical protein